MPQNSLLSYFSKSITVYEPDRLESRWNEQNMGRDVASVSTRRQAMAKASPKAGICGFGCKEERASDSQKHQIQAMTVAVHRGEVKNSRLQAVLEVASNPKSSSAGNTMSPMLLGAGISPVTEEHLPAIRRLTSTTLPVRYSPAFFTTTVTDPVAQKLSRVALYGSEPVGWIRCRVEPCSPNTSSGTNISFPRSQIYIQALAVLSPYRNLGLATALLSETFSAAVSLGEKVVCIYAHVWEMNEDALEWYAKRGFKRVMLVERYYLKLKPSGAWIVRRELDDT